MKGRGGGAAGERAGSAWRRGRPWGWQSCHQCGTGRSQEIRFRQIIFGANGKCIKHTSDFLFLFLFTLHGIFAVLI